MRRTLEQGLPELGMGSGLIPRLAGFAELVLERNQVMNLTAITEPKDVAALHLLDSLGKRVDFLREACGKLGLENVECIHQRAEEFAGARREAFDFAVSRAVAALPVLCELCLPLVKVGGKMLAMKSANSDEEIQRAGHAAEVLGGRVEWVKDYTIPTTDVVHRVVCVEKVKATPGKYPRRFALIKKQPL